MQTNRCSAGWRARLTVVSAVAVAGTGCVVYNDPGTSTQRKAACGGHECRPGWRCNLETGWCEKVGPGFVSGSQRK